MQKLDTKVAVQCLPPTGVERTLLGERQQSQGAACNLYLFDEVPGTVIERGTVESSKGEVKLGNSPLGKGKFNLKKCRLHEAQPYQCPFICGLLCEGSISLMLSFTILGMFDHIQTSS